ncbi:MAG TPA: D-amino acid aminotransferase [Gammaproteobacteria bacterium]|nr:D-amino acid aminotransferase [Gammaproteobacteria bacterium]
MSICWLNGEFLPLEDAKIHVLDRGFIFGDSIYEVIPVYGGKLFRLEEHLQRLINNLAAVKIDPKLNVQELRGLLEALVEHNGSGDLSVYVQVSRGVAARDHAFPELCLATIFAMANPLVGCSEKTLSEGASAITLDDIRWRYCHIKTTSLLANILLRQQALEEDATEAILIRDGLVTEGAASNLFLVVDTVLLTPPKSTFLLPGITRDLILELATKQNIAYKECDIEQSTLNSASEIWLSSSTKEIVPVTRLNGKQVGNGKPGNLWVQMNTHFQNYKDKVRQGLIN